MSRAGRAPSLFLQSFGGGLGILYCFVYSLVGDGVVMAMMVSSSR